MARAAAPTGPVATFVMQRLAEQIPEAQTFPQAPQFFASADPSMQATPQVSSADEHWQMPSAHA
jgi:hypothetical protein